MKFSMIPVAGALFVAGVNAKVSGCMAVAVKAIPNCAQTCFIDNAPSIGCDGFDFACQCEKQAAFFAAIESCVADSCETSQFQPVIDGAAEVCACAIPANSHHTVSGSVVPSKGTGSSIVPCPTTIGSVIPSGIASAYPTLSEGYPIASEMSGASSTSVKPPAATGGAGRSAQIGLGAGIAVAFALL
ncbi:hypothetical protein QR685DRAFT_450962 [Neurospora intermedia]|uniref:CFEM domain-containing protein n=1 Tax=Neurospora intermedia TaxID=5142 RepID=A0ABR3D4G4_NEUIN